MDLPLIFSREYGDDDDDDDYTTECRNAGPKKRYKPNVFLVSLAERRSRRDDNIV